MHSIYLDALHKANLIDIAERVLAGERLSFNDGLRLLRCPNLTAVGALANLVRERLNGNAAYWVRNRHINYTNICTKQCKFCGFYAKPDGPNPYVLTPEDVHRKLSELPEPPTEIHIVGGVNPSLPYSYYLDLLKAAKDACPSAHIKAFTMVELDQIVRAARAPIQDVLQQLKSAGLSSMPGGGAEVMSERLHTQLFSRKIGPTEWLSLSKEAHLAGIPTNATILYGHLETDEERIQHLIRLRDLQDETGGFLAFVPLAFDPSHTELAHLPRPTGYLDLRMVAVSRLMLDNIRHIKSFWVMVSPAVAQVSLRYGADDIDGTVVEYEITDIEGKGKKQSLTKKQLLQLIHEAGRVPVERDALYNPINPSPKPDASPPEAARQSNQPRSASANCFVVPDPLARIAEKVFSGKRLSYEDGVALITCPDLTFLSLLADHVRWRKHPEPIVTFTIGRNINYTNICCAQCRFCAFHRKPGDPEGYVLTTDELLAKIDELVKAGGREVLLQGGLNPYLKIDYFENLFRTIKQHYDVDLHALSSSEINHLARISGLSVEETLVRLRSAGLDTIPGAAEMLVDEVRRQISPGKETTQEWLNLMRTAHKLGIRTTATMMYGSLDTPPQRIEHLLRVRELQDETGGFTAFIPWNFQPDGTRLQEVLTNQQGLIERQNFLQEVLTNQQGLIERQNFLSVNKTSSFEYLRTVAVSRLMLDNIDNIQASWVTQGPKIAQISLRYGVNDFGSTMMEENVVRAAGTRFLMPIEEIRRLIIDAGYTPRIRDTLYRLLD